MNKTMMILPVIFVILTGIIFSVGQPPDSAFATEHKSGHTEYLFQQGYAALIFDDYEKAISIFEQVLIENPNHVPALTNLGASLSELGRYEEAVPYYDKVLEIEPKNHIALYNKGYDALNFDDYEKAISFFEQSLIENPNYFGALYSLGYSLAELGRYEEAIPYYDKVLEIDPKYESALLNRAYATGKLFFCNEAILYFDLLLEIEPENTYAIYKKSTNYAILGLPEEAVSNLDKVLEIDPNFIDSLEEPAFFVALDRSKWDINDWEMILKKNLNVWYKVSKDDTFLFYITLMDSEELAKVCNQGFVRGKPQEILQRQIVIPDWIRNNAEWWVRDAIGDSEFVAGIQYLIKEGIMQIPETEQTTSAEGTKEIPSWIKNNADWWAKGLISDDDFLKGIQYLVEQGIMVV